MRRQDKHYDEIRRELNGLDDVSESDPLKVTRKSFEMRPHDVGSIRSSPTAPMTDHRNSRRQYGVVQFHEQYTLISTTGMTSVPDSGDEHVEKNLEEHTEPYG